MTWSQLTAFLAVPENVETRTSERHRQVRLDPKQDGASVASMTFRRLLMAVFSFLAVAASQSNESPELRVRILTDKDKFASSDVLIAKMQLNNTTDKTLCFPKPPTDVHVAISGWIETKAEPAHGSDREKFIEVLDGGGKVGKELDAAIKNEWVKLKPGQSYLADPARTPVHLDEPGEWRLTATYHPPEGSFSAGYRKLLQDAAQKNGCTLPIHTAEAEPTTIVVSEKSHGQ